MDAVIDWVEQQQWAQPLGTPAGGTRLDESSAWDALRTAKVYEQGVELRWTREPDGGYSWAVFSTEHDQVRLQHGFADQWDDAKLAMIEKLVPRSDED